MKKILIFFTIFFVFCSKGNLEREYKNLNKSLEISKSSEEKAKLIKDFLQKFPETEYTSELIWDLLNYENPEGCIVFFQNLKEKIKDYYNIEDLNYCLLEAYKRTKNKEGIMEVFNSFKEPLKYNNYSETIKALVETGAFEEALKLIEETKKFLTMEYINEKYEKLSEERRKRYFSRFNFEILSLKGRIYAGLKEFDKAIQNFEEAKKFLKPSFQGTYLDDFNYYLALTLKEMGKYQEAISTIIPDVLFEKNDKNYGLFKEIYKEIYKTEEGEEEFLKTKKEEISPLAIDFNLKGYNGKEFNFKDVSKDKVTLLAFWFPT